MSSGPYCVPSSAAPLPDPASAPPAPACPEEIAAPLAGWAAKEAGCVLPASLMLTMWRQSLRWDIARGGCFEVRSASCLLLWPPAHGAGHRPAGPLAVVWLRWSPGPPAEVTLTRLAWNAAGGGTEDRVWAALEMLAGQSVRAL